MYTIGQTWSGPVKVGSRSFLRSFKPEPEKIPIIPRVYLENIKNTKQNKDKWVPTF